MKVRTFLLFACMIVVPGLAMFSHRVPAGVRSATRCALWDPIQTWAEGWSKPDSATFLAESDGGGAAVEAAADDAGGPAGGGVTRPVGLGGLGRLSGQGGESAEEPAARLAALGASGVDCRPFEAETGSHVASCRVPIDASGQLHRVFQAAGGSPQEAVSSLADQVEGWRDRLAARASGSDNPRGPAGF